jgi:hypothetical protein
MNPQDLYAEIGRYLDSKSQGRFGFAVVMYDNETKLVCLVHAAINQETAVMLCGIVVDNNDAQPSTEILTKERMI